MGLFLLILGIVGLWFGSGLVVESSKKLAKAFKVSQTLVGLSIISIGTSLPEIFTNIFAGINVLNGIPSEGVAIGTNLGSDITQITFILGITAILGTLYATKKLLYRDGGMVLLSIILMFIFGFTGGRISRIEGVMLVVGYLLYMYILSKDEHVGKKVMYEIGHDKVFRDHIWKRVEDFAIVCVGLAILIFASHLVVNNAMQLAEVWGVSQSIIGVMIIGVGTGLPELSTAIRGILKKAGDISLGTLIGSNVTDPMLSLGLGASIAGFPMEKNLLFFDIPFWFAASIIALLLIREKMQINRKEGIILVSLYFLFVIIKISYFMF